MCINKKNLALALSKRGACCIDHHQVPSYPGDQLVDFVVKYSNPPTIFYFDPLHTVHIVARLGM
ncbi:hypothetical protein Scep_022512 [Stephania cephalantha]|uniref:Uncharacterized protein n=1 Tax=Stephania cephalantha TaxID=152367 RepID=A0AAP0FFF4_9MAGN